MLTNTVTDFFSSQSIARLRRNRKSEAIRSLTAETRLLPSDFVLPLFLLPGKEKKEAVLNMPGCFRYSLDLLLQEISYFHDQGIVAFALFPIINREEKSDDGLAALNEEGLLPNALLSIKNKFPDICILSDIALDPYTTHGHDGVVKDHKILNDETVEILGQMACLHARAGADIVAPSDMMDGRVAYIRKKLDEEGHIETSILSYAIKYASSLYAPFRNALKTSLSFGDKKSYQLNPANLREALLEANEDDKEGADLLMVKPASIYLDVISELRKQTLKPIAAYHVSGEYAMVMAAHEKGYLDAGKLFYETLLSIKRAGADMIFTYAIPQVLPLFSR